MSPVRVLHITGGMDRAGVETMIMNLYRRTDRTRLQFDFLYFSNTVYHYDQEIESLGGKIYRIPTAANLAAHFLTTRKFLRAHPSFRAIHVHTLFHGGLYLLAARLAGTRIRIAHAHTSSDNLSLSRFGSFYQQLSKFLINRYANRFIACGRLAKSYLFDPGKEVVLLPNAIDVRRFSRARHLHKGYLRAELKLGESCTVLCQVGRLEYEKNHRFTLEVAAELKQRGTDFHLVLIGEGKLRRELEEYGRSLDVSDKITFLGTRTDIPELLAGTDIFLLPSFYEGFPVVLVESQAAGVPAMVSERVSGEVDLGVGLITFHSLADPGVWVRKIQHFEAASQLTTLERVAKVKAAGYDTTDSVAVLYTVYGIPFPETSNR